MQNEKCVCDANEAVATIAYALSDIIPVYPITPATPMGEHCELWASAKKNKYL